MLEVQGTQECIGTLLEIDCRTDCDLADKRSLKISDAGIGHRTLHLQITSSIARRVLHVSEPVPQLICRAEPDSINSSRIRFQLVRLSSGFAAQRMQALLTRYGLKRLPATPPDSLYKRYLDAVRIPQPIAQYPAWRKQRLPLDRDSYPPACADHRIAPEFSVIRADQLIPAGAEKNSETPFVLLADEELQLTSWFESVIRTVIDSDESVMLWYCDHEHIDSNGVPGCPVFKPQWNPGLLHQGNYIGPLLICRRQFYSQLGGIDLTTGASRLYDFLLRASQIINRHAVARIPAIGYQRSLSSYIPPHGFSSKKDDQSVLQRFIRRAYADKASLHEGPYQGTWQIRHRTDIDTPTVSIIIPTRNRTQMLKTCVNTLLSTTDYPAFTVTLVDNQSDEPSTLEYYRSLSDDSRIRLIQYHSGFNFSAMNNLAAAQSDSDVLLLLNNDIEITQAQWLRRMVSEAVQVDVGCVGARLVYGNGFLQHAGVIVGMQGVASHVNRLAAPQFEGYGGSNFLSADYSAVTAACLAIRRKVFEELQGFDQKNLPVCYNDVDLCLRAREAGYRNRLLADVQLIHHESMTRGNEVSSSEQLRHQREKEYMQQRHAKWISNDPAWSPHFSRGLTYPSLTQYPNIFKKSHQTATG